MIISSKFFYQKNLDKFMKKLLGIVVLGLLLSGNAYAEMESLPEGTIDYKI